jgi:hypothetical protein
MAWSAAILLFALSGICRLSPAHAATDGTGVPARIGNIYNGLDHQPTQSKVQAREQAAGIGLNPVQQRRNAAILDELYQQLEGEPAN